MELYDYSMDQIETVTAETTNVISQPQQVVTKKTVVNPPAIKTEHPQKTYEKKKALFHTQELIWFVVGFIEAVLGFRIVLKLFGANPASPFTNLIYSVSEPFAFLFGGIFRSTISGNSVIEWSSMFAMLVYVLVAIGLIQLIRLFKPVTPEEVAVNVDETA